MKPISSRRHRNRVSRSANDSTLDKRQQRRIFPAIKSSAPSDSYGGCVVTECASTKESKSTDVSTPSGDGSWDSESVSMSHFKSWVHLAVGNRDHGVSEFIDGSVVPDGAATPHIYGYTHGAKHDSDMSVDVVLVWGVEAVSPGYIYTFYVEICSKAPPPNFGLRGWRHIGLDIHGTSMSDEGKAIVHEYKEAFK